MGANQGSNPSSNSGSTSGANQKLETLLDKMWQDYCAFNPEAERIFKILSSQGEAVFNDHIALRTFNHPRLGIKSLAQHFEKLGYQAKGDYLFKEKKLFALHYEHPDQNQPKIFISELELEKVSKYIQREVDLMVEQLKDAQIQSENFPYCGRPWKMSHKTYLALAQESEYASWVAAFGFRPNHFTVNVNALKKFPELQGLNDFLKKQGYKLNASGGEIKGSPSEYLEQSSTMAGVIPVDFTDGKFEIPACYYEFAKRYPLENGKLYQGFVAKSADKIFESTNRGS